MRLPKIIADELALIPGRWRLERGARHLRLFIDGRFISILPHDGYGSDSNQRGNLNIRAHIRRAIRHSDLEVGIRRRSGTAANVNT